MKKLAVMMFMASLALSTAAHAADAEKAPNKQQNKMAQCNQDAGDKKGDERKKFMSECLKNKQKAQQDKMKTCNKEATGKKGEERKQFMSSCLKKDPA